MEINSKEKLKTSLYKFEVMTAQQLATVHSYKTSTIYPYMKELDEKGAIGKIDVPALGRGSKAYHLTSVAAKKVAEDFNELNVFREKEWNTAPSNVIKTLLANQFFCELIKATKTIEDSGITDWKGSRTIQQAYLLGGETKLPPKMNGYASFYLNGKFQRIYLNVLTGNESLSIIEEMLVSHTDMIQREWPGKEDETLFLFLCLGTIRKTVLKLWKKVIGATAKVPFLAVADFEMLSQKGVFGAVWLQIGSTEYLSILDMPSQSSKRKDSREFIGKKKIIRLQFSPVVQSLEFNNGGDAIKEVKDEQDSPVDIDKEEIEGEQVQTDENGIDWSIS